MSPIPESFIGKGRGGNRKIRYTCTKCGRDTPREDLTVKRVVFADMGERAKYRRARVVAWLCPECLEIDPVWNSLPTAESPGAKNTVVIPRMRSDA